jgi:hypothetical protein
MAITFPSSPSISDEFLAAGKAWLWNGFAWRQFGYAIIDGGFSTTEILDEASTTDGGTA